jgi:hypothetical protein
LLKHFIEGNIECWRKRGIGRKQLLEDLKEERRYCILKDKELDRISWRSRLEEALEFSQGRKSNEFISLNRLPIIKMALGKLIVLLYFSSKLTHINSYSEAHIIGLWCVMLKSLLLFFNENELN